VLRTALRLIDACEPGSFSMRRLADELGVGVMTLYGYVRDKDELYEAVTALASSEVEGDPIDEAPWYEEVCTAARELYGLCRRHPNLVSTLLTDRKPHPGLFRTRERIFNALHDAGFPTPVAVLALRACSSYVLGSAVAENSAAVRHLPERIWDEDAHELPGFSAVTDDHAAHAGTDSFEYGLSLLIRSLRAGLAEL
jgi:AcrR family transcriptional regulator